MAAVQRYDKIDAKIGVKAGIPPKGSAKDNAKMKGYNKPIPKKARFGKTSNKGENSQGAHSGNIHTEKLCQLCMKHFPNVKNNHNMVQCCEWNHDNSERCWPSHGQTPRNTNAQSRSEEDTKDVCAQMRKEIKALKKLTKKRDRKQSCKRHYESSNNNNSSDEK